jgi:hypothetical protein
MQSDHGPVHLLIPGSARTRHRFGDVRLGRWRSPLNRTMRRNQQPRLVLGTSRGIHPQLRRSETPDRELGARRLDIQPIGARGRRSSGLHHLLHQRCRTTTNVLEPGPEDKPDRGRIAGSRGVLPTTTEQKASSPSPVQSEPHVASRGGIVVSSLVSSVYVRPRSLVFGLMRQCRSRTLTVFGELLSRLLKIGRSAVRPRPWPLYLVSSRGHLSPRLS